MVAQFFFEKPEVVEESETETKAEENSAMCAEFTFQIPSNQLAEQIPEGKKQRYDKLTKKLLLRHYI